MTDNIARLDPSQLTMGEIARVEELSGQPFTGLSDDNRPKGKALAALAYVAKKRHEPAFTWNQALALTLDQVRELVDMDDDEDAPAGDPDAADAGEDEQGKE